MTFDLQSESIRWRLPSPGAPRVRASRCSSPRSAFSTFLASTIRGCCPPDCPLQRLLCNRKHAEIALQQEKSDAVGLGRRQGDVDTMILDNNNFTQTIQGHKCDPRPSGVLSRRCVLHSLKYRLVAMRQAGHGGVLHSMVWTLQASPRRPFPPKAYSYIARDPSQDSEVTEVSWVSKNASGIWRYAHDCDRVMNDAGSSHLTTPKRRQSSRRTVTTPRPSFRFKTCTPLLAVPPVAKTWRGDC